MLHKSIKRAYVATAVGILILVASFIATPAVYAQSDPPVFPNAAETFRVLENATSGTVGTVTAADTANQIIIFSVGGTDATTFNRDFSLRSVEVSGEMQGEITVKVGASIDYETKSSYSVTITATDTDSETATVAVTINVVDLYDDFPSQQDELYVTGIFEVGLAVHRSIDAIHVPQRFLDGIADRYAFAGDRWFRVDSDSSLTRTETSAAFYRMQEADLHQRLTVQRTYFLYDPLTFDLLEELVFFSEPSDRVRGPSAYLGSNQLGERTAGGSAISGPGGIFPARAQAFTTGGSETSLAAVRMNMSTTGVKPRVSIYSDNSGSPGTSLHVLANPAWIDTGWTSAEEFTASGVTLVARTKYWVVVESPDGSGIRVGYTRSDDQATGWAIDDDHYWKRADGTWTSQSSSLLIALRAPATHTVPFFATGPLTLSVAENAAADTVVGTVAGTDTDGDPLTYSVGGTDATAFNQVFTMSTYTAEIKVKDGATVDYETKSSYSVTISVTDGKDASGNTEDTATTDATVNVILSVTNADEPGVVSLSAATPTVGSALTATLADPDGSVSGESWSWSSATTRTGTFSTIGGANTATYTPVVGDVGKYLKATVGYTDSFASGKSALRISTNATVANANSPTAINSAVSTSINTAHTFSASHFNFRATTSGDTLSKVHILTLPNRGTLALSGTAVTAGDEITRAQLNAGNLKFTPATDGFGDGYASFLFRVEGSSLESTDGYRMTIDVRPAPPAALAADGKTLTLTYNEPMKETSTPANDAFTVEATPAGGSEAEVELAATNGVSVSGSTVVLKLDSPIAHNDGSVKVTYDKPGSGAVIEDANGNEAPGFTDQSVTNNSLIPRVSIEALFPDASPAIADPKFKFTRSIVGTNRLRVGLEIDQPQNYMNTFLRAEIDPNQTEEESNAVTWDSGVNNINTNGMMTLTVIGGDDHLPALAPNNSATIEIKLPAMGPTIRVEFQEDAHTIDEGIGNLVLGVVYTIAPGVAAPREGGLRAAVLTETISGPTTMLPLEEDSATINVDYKHISRNTTRVYMNDWICIQGEGCTHTANVNVPILEDDKHERDEKFRYYLDPTPGVTERLHLDSTRHIITILDNDPLVVTDVTVSSTPTGGYYDATDSIEFTVPFNGSVTVTGTPRLTFDLGGQTRQANYASGSDTEELLFTYTVTASDADDPDGISWGANALGLNGGTIKFTSTEVSAQVAADLAHPARGPLSAHKVLVRSPTRTEPSDADLPYSDATWGYVDTSASSSGRMDATYDVPSRANRYRSGDWWKLRVESGRRYRVQVEFGSGSNQARGGGIDVNYDAALWDHNRDDGLAFVEFTTKMESYHLRVRARDFLNEGSATYYGGYQITLTDITGITKKVSNTGAYSGSKTEVSNTLWKTSSFDTGDNAGGYKLSYVATGLHDKTGANSVKAELWTAGASGPDTKIFDFLRAGKITGHPTAQRSDRFWAPSNAANLATSTRYWVVFKELNSGAAYDLTRADSGLNNPGAASGWVIRGQLLKYDTTATTPFWGVQQGSAPILLEVFASNVEASNASQPNDSTAPQLQSATVDGYTLTLAYDEPLDETDTPSWSAFTVSVGGSPGWIRSVVVDQSDVRVYVADPVGGGTVTVDYTVPTDEAAGRVQDTSGNAAGSFSGQAVTNNTTDQVAPLFQSATVDEHTVTLTYNETLRELVTPPSSAYIVTVGGSAGLVISVVVDQSAVRLQLAAAVAMGDTVTVDYTVPTSAALGRVQDTSGNVAVSLSEQAVTNSTTSSGTTMRSDEQAPPGVPEGLDVALQQSGKLKATWKAPGSGPAPTGYTVQWKAAVDAWEDSSEVSETGVTKTSYVIGGLTDGVEYAARVVATRDGADSAPSEEVTATPQETTPPELLSASVDGARLTLTFDEPLDAGEAPDRTAFAVTVAGSGRGVDTAAVSGSVVTLTLVTAVFAGDAVTVAYAAPTGDSASRLQDLAGNAAASFSGEDVPNDTQAADPMTASAHDLPAAHDGSTTFTFELRFSETPAAGFSYKTLRDNAFTVTGGEVVKARRLEKGRNVRWEISVVPEDGDGAVTIALPATTDCEADGAVCTDDGRKLSPGLEFEVPGLSTPEISLSTPEITSGSSFSVDEGATEVATLRATDGDTPAANLTWSISGGDDEAKFAVTAAGALSFAAAKDYEAPDDADTDGVYEVTVQVSDGGRTDSANLTVTLTNVNEAPTADAGANQENVAQGDTVTLNGSGTDPDAGEVFSFAWVQTSGATVTLSDTAAALPTFTAPTGQTSAAELIFTLRVTDDEGLFAEDSVTVAISGQLPLTPLTASTHGVPASHDGNTAFTFELRFSETPREGFSYKTLRDNAFTATGGEVVKVRRLEKGKNVRWEISVTPDGNGPVTIVLPATTDCTAQGAICTQDGRMLSNRLEITVPGPGG